MWKIALLSSRNLHTSLCWNGKLGRVMKKVMGSSSKRKRIVSEPGVLPNAEMFTKGSYEGRYSGNARRVSVLNKLFMKHITDLLATGEYSSEFTGHGIEINRVQISPDYNGLNVFWVAKGTKDDEVVEKLLKKNAGFLRHELSSLRVMGVVPRIYFVKDKQYSQIIELDSRLAEADFGEDHVPIETATKLKTQLELFIPLPPDIREKIQKLDEDLLESENFLEDLLPPMPQNVLGLNHSEILNRIKSSLKKSEALHRVNKDGIELTQSTNENPIEFGSNKERREAFKSFLQKRELMKSKIRKMEKNYLPDMEYMREEYKEAHTAYFKNLEIYEPENDYTDDVDELDKET